MVILKMDLIKIKDLCFSYPTKKDTLKHINIKVKKGTFTCIVGENGSGKSTLLKTIIGQLEPLDGYMNLGHQIEIGYFDQTLANFHSGNTVLEELWNEYPMLDMYEVRSTLGAFLFSADDVFKEVNVLSGGEKALTAIALLFAIPALFTFLIIRFGGVCNV